jgi:hypothetical protein
MNGSFRIPLIWPLGLSIVLMLFCIKPIPVPGRVSLKAPVQGAVLNNPAISFIWDTALDGERFVLQVATDVKFQYVSAEDTTTQKSLILILKTDNKYYWRVRAQTGNGVWGEWSEPDSFILQRFSTINSLKTRGYPHDIAIQANLAYIADGQAGLAVYWILMPPSPSFLSRIMDSLNIAWAVAVRDTLVFVAYGYKELLIVNAARPESLKIIGVLEYPQPGYGYDLAQKDSWVYIAAGAQFIAVNVTDPRYPNLRFQYYYPRDCRGLVISGSYLFLACEQLGIASWRIDTFPPVNCYGTPLSFALCRLRAHTARRSPGRI